MLISTKVTDEPKTFLGAEKWKNVPTDHSQSNLGGASPDIAHIKKMLHKVLQFHYYQYKQMSAFLTLSKGDRGDPALVKSTFLVLSDGIFAGLHGPPKQGATPGPNVAPPSTSKKGQKVAEAGCSTINQTKAKVQVADPEESEEEEEVAAHFGGSESLTGRFTMFSEPSNIEDKDPSSNE